MKKNILFLLLLCLCLTGCFDKGKIKVKFNCNGIVKEYKVKTGDVFKCSLFASDYEIKIVDIKDDKFTIESNNSLSTIDDMGRVTDSNSTQTLFEIPKGKTALAVPLDGLLYTIEFEW